MPALGQFTVINVQDRQSAAAMRLHLAVEIYRATHGRYPGTLSALVPDVLPEIPVDPHNGLEFGYRLLAPGEDPRDRGFLLYSFGADMQDNRGEAGRRDAHRAFLPGNAGLDFVFNVPRETQDEVDREAQETIGLPR